MWHVKLETEWKNANNKSHDYCCMTLKDCYFKSAVALNNKGHIQNLYINKILVLVILV